MSTGPTLPDHIGWDLIRAARLWETRFSAAMSAAGHLWFAEARGRLFQFIGPDGTSQSRIVARSGLTKQAIQQHLDRLVEDGVVARIHDPDDARRVRIVLTAGGRAAMADADRIKADIETQIQSEIGTERMEWLRLALKDWLESESSVK